MGTVTIEPPKLQVGGAFDQVVPVREYVVQGLTTPEQVARQVRFAMNYRQIIAARNAHAERRIARINRYGSREAKRLVKVCRRLGWEAMSIISFLRYTGVKW